MSLSSSAAAPSGAGTHADVSPAACPAPQQIPATCFRATGSPSCSSGPSLAPSRVSAGNLPSPSVSSLSKEQPTTASVRRAPFPSFLMKSPAVFVVCAAVLSSCLSILVYPSFMPRLLSPTFFSSPLLLRFSRLFHYYCLRPTGGGDAARALTTPILLLSAVYLPAVFLLQRWMRDREAFHLKMTCIVWNLMLSCLSLVGFVVMLFSQPSLLVRPMLPEPEFTPAVRAVICVFTLSKAIEYGDTVLLALRKKPLIFLHLYHHVTVTLYCWHAQLVRVSVGHYFAFVNLGIHAWMYLYYALAALFPRHPLLRTWRPLITISQIVQMCFGLSLASYALTQGLPVEEHFNAGVAVAMYVSYACLFVHFFFNTYIRRSSPCAPRRRASSFFSTPLQLVILIHLLAAAGLYLLLTHKRRNTLLLEILMFSAATTAVLLLVIRTHHTTNSISYLKTVKGFQNCCLTTSASYCNSSSIGESDTHKNNSVWCSRRNSTSSSTVAEGDFTINSFQEARSNSSGLVNQSSLLAAANAGNTAAAVAVCPACDAALQLSGGVGRVTAAPHELQQVSEQQQQRPPKAEGTHSYGALTCTAEYAAARVHAEGPASPAASRSEAVPAAGEKGCWAAADATALGCGGHTKPEREPKQHQEGAPHICSSASLLPAVRGRPQHSSDSGSDSSSGTDGSSSNSTRSTDSCSLLTVGGGSAKAQQEKLMSPSSTAAAYQACGFDQEGKRCKAAAFEALRKSMSGVSTNRTELSSENSSAPRLSKTSASMGRSTVPAAAVVTGGREEQRHKFLAAAQAALQGGGQTLLTISNFVLACALKRLVDSPEATAAAGRTPADANSGSGGAAAEVAPPRAVVAGGQRDIDGSGGAAAVAAAWGDNAKQLQQQQQAAAERHGMLSVEQQQRQRDGGETEGQACTTRSPAGCCSSSVLLLKTQLAGQQQDVMAALAERPMKGVHHQEFHGETFCEEVSTTVCSSPESLTSLDHCSAAPAGSGITAAGAEVDLPVGLAGGGAAAACETPAATVAKLCFPVCLPSLDKAAAAAAGKKELQTEMAAPLYAEKKSLANLETVPQRDVADAAAHPCVFLPQAAAAAQEDVAAAAGERGAENASDLGQNQQQQMGKPQPEEQEGRGRQQQQQQHEQPVTEMSAPQGDSRISSLTSPMQSSSSEGLEIFHWRGQQEVKKTGSSASARELLLAATCAGLPAFYGWLIHENALLGLCVHGALRWLLEFYTSCTLYSRHRRPPTAAARKGGVTGEKIVMQQRL